jgi:type IV pilus assembly protein PilF
MSADFRAKTAVLILAAALSACVHTGFGSNKNPQQAAQANIQLAIEYMKMDKLAMARDYVERGLAEDADNASVQATAGMVYERIGDMSKADHAYSRAEHLGSGDPSIQNSYAGFLCRTGKTAAGEKLFGEVARNPLYQTPEVALVNAGVCVGGKGDADGAERYFNRALAIHPNMPEALLQMGTVEFDRGNAAKAFENVQRYLAVNPPTPEILWLALRAERKLGDASAAASYARHLQDEFPTSEQAQMLRSGTDR